MRTCKKCGYQGDNFEKNRHVCKECRKTQRDLVKYQEYQKTEKRKKQKLINSAKWRRENRGKHNANGSLARAKRIKRNVSWADLDYIKDIYKNAKEASLIFGIPFEVDHILPLCGKTVSGFHHENNLQVLPRNLNREKYNHV